MSHRF